MGWAGAAKLYCLYSQSGENKPKVAESCKARKKQPGMQCDLRHCGPWKQFDLSAMKTSGHSMFLMQRRRLCAGWRTCNYRATTLELFRLVEGTRYMIYIYIIYMMINNYTCPYFRFWPVCLPIESGFDPLSHFPSPIYLSPLFAPLILHPCSFLFWSHNISVSSHSCISAILVELSLT